MVFRPLPSGPFQPTTATSYTSYTGTYLLGLDNPLFIIVILILLLIAYFLIILYAPTQSAL